MILTEEEILKIIKDNPSPAVSTGANLQNDHKVHIRGKGFEDVLEQIIGYENVEQYKQKKLLTQPFTRPIFKKIIDAQSRWKTARGTKRLYKFEGNGQELQKQFRDDILSEVWHGTSVEIFVHDFLSKALYEEFNGFTVVEKGKALKVDGITYEVRGKIRRVIVNPTEKLKPYFIFISIEDVHNYLVSGHTVEWIAYKYGTEERKTFMGLGKTKVQLFRVIDDKYDYIVEKVGDKIRISDTYPVLEHSATKCPVSNITYINETLTNPLVKTSPVDIIIKLLDYHLHQYAEHLTTEVLHAHPIYYQVGQECTWVVEGVSCVDGRIVGQSDKTKTNFDTECPNCKGTGHNMHKDASTVLILPATDAEGKAFSITSVAGYVSPAVDILKYQQDAIDWMEVRVLDAALGLNNFKANEGLEHTATGVLANMKPLEDIISDIIDVAQGVETSLTDFAGKMFYGDTYLGSEILYGRKISLRDENVILKEITDSKAAGVPMSHIKSLMEELIYSRFVRSEYDLARSLVMIELEPLVGKTDKEVQDSTSIATKTKFFKSNFNDLIQRFELEHGDIVEFESGSEFSKRIVKIGDILKVYVDEIMEDSGDPPPPEPIKEPIKEPVEE